MIKSFAMWVSLVGIVGLAGCPNQEISLPSDITEVVAANEDQLSVWKTCENGNAFSDAELRRSGIRPVSYMHSYKSPPPPAAPVPFDPDDGEPNDVIVNGDVVVLAGRYPHMAHLMIEMTDGIGWIRGRCGGSIIDSRWILTAAHCIDVQYAEDKYNSQFPAGTPRVNLDLNKVTVGVGGVEYSALDFFDGSKALCHTNYNKTGDLEDDIALIRLDTPLPLNATTIKVGQLPSSDDGLGGGTPVPTIPIGYGTTEAGVVSPKLLEIELQIDPTKVENTTFTAYEVNGYGNICMGDSGSPTHLANNLIAGLSSYVLTPSQTSCNYLDVPSVFTRIAPYVDNIHNAIQNCTNDDTCFQ